MAFFAGVLGSFYYSRFWAHSKDDQTCAYTFLYARIVALTLCTGIIRHGQQPGNPKHTSNGTRLVLTSNYVEPPRGPAHIPLPNNDDNRGSEGTVGRVMTFIAVSRVYLEAGMCSCHESCQGRGLHPDGKQPEHPTNIQVPPQQRTNAAHSHFYTKVSSCVALHQHIVTVVLRT